MQKFFVFYFFADVFLFMDLLNPRFIFNPRFKSWAKEGFISALICGTSFSPECPQKNCILVNLNRKLKIAWYGRPAELYLQGDSFCGKTL